MRKVLTVLLAIALVAMVFTFVATVKGSELICIPEITYCTITKPVLPTPTPTPLSLICIPESTYCTIIKPPR